MTVKSNYKLDDRIESMDDVQTCLQYDDSYIGERGYFATDLSDLSDLSKCVYSTLFQIISDGAGDDIFRTPHDVDYDNWGSRFFVPERLLKSVEKKYRPFSLNEFLEQYKVGDLVEYRIKGCSKVECVMFTGYETDTDRSGDKKSGENEIVLGNIRHSLEYLFEYYELFFEDKWQSFGVEE